MPTKHNNSNITSPNPNHSSLQFLSDLYLAYEKTLCVRNGEAGEHGHLPHFNGNKSLPIHKWFTYKEGFSSQLLSWVCDVTGINLNSVESLLDPFAGVATSLLSAQLNYRGQHNLNLVGIERNPFVAFVARTKLCWQLYSEKRILELIPKLVARIRMRGGVRFEIADLSTLRNEKIFNRRRLHDLLFARDVINEELHGLPEIAFFQLGWASVIEAASNVRKDGRALRLVSKEERPPVYKLLEKKWKEMLSDVQAVSKQLSGIERGFINAQLHEGDGRSLDVLENDQNRYDLIIYSPPYLNNLDYSEVYKMELWLTGAVTTQEDFRNLRLRTLRSHPSVKFPETDIVDRLRPTEWPKALRDALIEVIPKSTHKAARIRTIRAYMDDMLLSLQNQYRVAKPGAYIICVVGNSVHGTKEHPIPIATDLLIASLAEVAGFEVEKVQITRYTKRRDFNERVQRESIIILRRP
jgi:hypothetical protein